MHQEVETKLNEMSRNDQEIQTSCGLDHRSIVAAWYLGLEFAESLSSTTNRPTKQEVMGERETPQDLFRFTTVMTRLAVVVSSDMIYLKNSEVPLFGQNPWSQDLNMHVPRSSISVPTQNWLPIRSLPSIPEARRSGAAGLALVFSFALFQIICNQILKL